MKFLIVTLKLLNLDHRVVVLIITNGNIPIFLYHITFINNYGFSSPELKAQVSFSDHLLSVCPSVCSSVCKLSTFSSSSEPQGQIQPNMARSIGDLDSICSNEEPSPLPRGEYFKASLGG